ncbi:MAG: histidine--tRNA ligase [Planctomycetes bacterium]|nr:histidine--tRNA ligase [Planctomycetota bacterium]
MKEIKVPTGTSDILPEQIPLWRYVEDTVRTVFERYGYSEIRTPIFEYTALFNRAIGDTSDIVEKEMYTFNKSETPGEDSVTLRPELTAPIVRSYLENNLPKIKQFQKLYYCGPLFRYERPQKGRRRQFTQAGVEALGSTSYLLDADKCRDAYRDTLKKYLEPHLPQLCGNCQRRFQRNVFRILDCKTPNCIAINKDVPAFDKYLCADCRAHFDNLIKTLDESGMKYGLDKHLVRGFDYYTKTIFEITHSSLGAQDALCGGGRYDDLIAELGGPSLGAVGFAIGLERTMLALESADIKMPEPPRPKVFVAVIDQKFSPKAFHIITTLRQKGISADMDYEGKSVKSQFRTADKLKSEFVITIGEDEITKQTLKLKNMVSGTETEVNESEFLSKPSF